MKVIQYDINQNYKMQGKNQFCQICGNHHSGQCSYEITYFTYYPESQAHIPKLVELVGSWYRWQNHEKMDKKMDNKGYTYFMVGSNAPIGKFEYKFIVDGKWTYCKSAPTIIDPYGSYNNVVQVLPKKAVVQYTPKQDNKFTCSLAMEGLKIVGSWDNWAGEITMQLGYNNLKGCLENYVYLQLTPDMHYEFKFKYNNQYLIDEKYPTVINQFGSQNNRIYIRSQSMYTPTYWRLNKSNSVRQFNCRCFQWQRIQVQSNYSQYKKTLDGHSMCQIGQYIYIFGGRTHNDFTNRLTKVNIHKLSCMHGQEILPNQRAFHYTAAYGNKMIIYGGHNKVILQDYHAFNTSEKTWLPSPEIKGTFPSKRQKQSCILYQTLLVFFGGYYCSHDIQFEQTYNDLQVLDIQEMKWIDENSIKVNGNLPNPRFSHTSALIHQKMYIFGGKNINNDKGFNHHTFFNDIWVMNLSNVSDLHWTQLKPKGNPPLARHGHTMNAFHQFLVIFGGQGYKGERYNDVVVFDSQKSQWIYPIIKSKTNFSQPVPRVYHGATVINNEYIVIFGGKNINEKSTSFYVLKPKDPKLDLDIQQQSQEPSSDEKSEEQQIKIGEIRKVNLTENFLQGLQQQEQIKQK